jgi:hypothetical protein
VIEISATGEPLGNDFRNWCLKLGSYWYETPDLDPTSQLRLHILHLSLLQPVRCHCQSLLLALPSTGEYDVTETSESPILPLNFLHVRKYQFYLLFLRSFSIMISMAERTRILNVIVVRPPSPVVNLI